MYTFIAEEQANPECAWSVTQMCRVLQVSRSGFYDWQSRPPSEREVTDRLLAAEIEAIWECSARTYGAPRVHAWLRRQGYRVARKRVARVMREHGWTGVMGRIRVPTTRRDNNAAPAADLVARGFNPDAPDRIWAGDVTYLPTAQGWLYLATVLDLYSRRVIGWALADHLRAGLVCDALTMAVATRGGHVHGVVFHSDRGCQYTSRQFRRLCARMGVTQSMGATGVCWDNSPSEAFFATLKRELVHRYTWVNRAVVRRAVAHWIEGWYNARRLHSSISYLSPIDKEDSYLQTARAA
ncbi:MAG: IS3 family transposase [Actinomycetota bacterium]|nr:IS3 family transposase [Actinomycetota bacterium]